MLIFYSNFNFIPSFRSYLSLLFHFILFFRVKEEVNNFAFDENSASVIKLNNGTVLYFREVGHYLAVVCILREENFERRGNFFTYIPNIIVVKLSFLYFMG